MDLPFRCFDRIPGSSFTFTQQSTQTAIYTPHTFSRKAIAFFFILEYTEEEIFSDLNDSSDTFDGNDIKNFSKIKFESFKTIVNNYLKRLNLNINNYNHKMSDQSQNQNPNQKETKTEKEEEISEGLTLISTETYLTSQDQDNPGTSYCQSFEIKQQEDSPK
jgi:hypothetical protein